MAETRNRTRLTHGSRRRRRRLRSAVTTGAALAALVAAGWLAVRGLRLAGFELRWKAESRSAEPAGGVGPRAGSPARAPGGTAAAPAGRAQAPPTVRSAPAGSGVPATIGFERFVDGRVPCTPCAVGDEWSVEGLVVSFRSWSADSTRPMVLDGSDYLPTDHSTRVLGPAFRAGRGLEVGVIRLDFPGRPRQVSFSLFGPDLVRRFEVAAWSGASALDASRLRRTVRRRYEPAAGGLFREVRITVTADGGIDRVSLDGWGPPGHLLFVDDVEIAP